ncbi:hypothetical protein AOE01nite_16370 [Acetobacter oeni]|uniref:Uncharacterized protein n=1 Tax=Acetobacter oeni TaxID=304077 RepID=A0A511XKD9_9PROT|nr:hypothetical protein AOE01nite_16370 [Acetobacter oeni]
MWDCCLKAEAPDAADLIRHVLANRAVERCFEQRLIPMTAFSFRCQARFWKDMEYGVGTEQFIRWKMVRM